MDEVGLEPGTKNGLPRGREGKGHSRRLFFLDLEMGFGYALVRVPIILW